MDGPWEKEAKMEVVEGREEEGEREVWRPRKEGWGEGHGGEGEGGAGYLSVNAVTLEAGQEGLDLREWTERGWVGYYDSLDHRGEELFARPCRGGAY